MSDERLRALNLKLGRDSEESSLDAVPRALGREALAPFPDMVGFDIWNAYEAGYVRADGLPRVLHLQLRYAAATPSIVESKSLKLYLNALTAEVFPSDDAYSDLVCRDLAAVVGGTVIAKVFTPEHTPSYRQPNGVCLDNLTPAKGSRSQLLKRLAKADGGETFAFYSHLFRSNCPVTGQPDWGTVILEGGGEAQPDPSVLLGYLLTYRQQQDFHESCCEAIFSDLHRSLSPRRLAVACHYTRRGGIDINPYRSTRPLGSPDWHPVWRQ